MESDLVSIIVTTYSRPQYLKRAIDSVINQTYSHWELIIVDDNGLESINQKLTRELVAMYTDKRIKYIPHDLNLNGAVARNTGLSIMNGEFFTFLDDDDYIYPNRLQLCVESLNSNSEYGFCYSSFERKRNDKVVSYDSVQKSGNFQLDLLKLKWRFGTGSNPFFRREVYKTIGGFNPNLLRKQDLEYVCRAFDYFDILAIPNLLVTKNIESKANIPNFNLYENVTNIFFSSLLTSTRKYPSVIINEIYRNHWFELSLMALNVNDQKNFLKFIRYAFKYKIINLKQCLKIFKTLFVKTNFR